MDRAEFLNRGEGVGHRFGIVRRWEKKNEQSYETHAGDRRSALSDLDWIDRWGGAPMEARVGGAERLAGC